MVNKISTIQNKVENNNFLSNEMRVEFEFKLKNILLLIENIEIDKLNNEFTNEVNETLNNLENDIMLIKSYDDRLNLNKKFNSIKIIEKYNKTLVY